MKKHLLFLIVILPLLSHAQGEWQWAKSYSGRDDYGGYPNNEIICADFDADGNIYVMGKFGHEATIDGEKILHDSIHNKIALTVSNLGLTYDLDHPGTFIAKFSSQGDMVWKKVIKMHSSAKARPSWMEVKNDRVHFLANLGFHQALYYLDTLVLETNHRQPDSVYVNDPIPYRHIHLNCFVTFDLDGNVLDEHFLRLYQRESSLPFIPHTGQISIGHFIREGNPFHVDRGGNIYILAYVHHYGAPVEEPLTIAVDEEKFFDFHTLRANGGYDGALGDWILFKFSPDWDLIWHKQLVHHTTGINHELKPGDPNGYSISVHDMSFDDEDNLYVCGSTRIDHVSIPEGYHTYPVKIYWDSIHHTIIKGEYAASEQSFLCKYDTSGNVQWTKQLYPSYSGSPLGIFTNFRDVIVKENDVYLFGNGSDMLWESYASDICIDEELTIPIGRLNDQQGRSFYIKYDRLSGEYISHSYAPHEKYIEMNGKASIINNHIVFSNRQGLGSNTCLITYFRDDGVLMRRDYFPGHSSGLCAGNIHIHESGKLFFYTQTKSSLTIGDFYLPQTGNYSMAAFALQEDPSLLTPYEYGDIGITSYEQNQKYQLYPNPTSGEVSLGNALVAHAYIHDYLKMELYDLSGRKLTETTAYSLNLAPYAPGMYIVKIQFINGQAVSRKVVRN